MTGVAAGIADYFGTEPIWVRLAFVAGTLFNGIGLLAYVIMAIALPREAPDVLTYEDAWQHDLPKTNANQRTQRGPQRPEEAAEESQDLTLCSACNTISKPYSVFCHKCGAKL